MGGAWTEAEGFVLSKSRRRESRPDRALARSRPRGGLSSFLRRAAHQARIGPCGAPSVGIRRAGNRPMSTNWRHAASGRAGLHTPPDRSEPEDGVGTRTPRGVSSSSPDDSRPSRCLQTMLRKEQSSLGARRAVETNCGRRAASMVQGLDRRLDLRRDFDKPRPSASARHQPPITPLSRPTLLTGQGLAQAEKPKPACSLAPHSSRASTGEERRIDLHPVLLRAGVLPRPDKLRASREVNMRVVASSAPVMSLRVAHHHFARRAASEYSRHFSTTMRSSGS